MALDPEYFFYAEGTITLTNGSDLATGQFTAWDPAVLPFDFVFPNDGTAGMGVIKEVLGMEEIRLAKPWTGPTLTNVPYFMVRWTRHTDPRIYGVRVSDYLTRLKGIPENIEEVAQEIHADRVAIEAAMATFAAIEAAVEADRQDVDTKAAQVTAAAQAAADSAEEAEQWAQAASTMVIPDNGVSNAKLADMPGDTIKGRRSSTGDPQDLTAVEARVVLGLEVDLSNLLINSHPRMNQRAFAGGSLAAGVYGYDRWRAGAGGANVTYSNSWVLTSGSIEQTIEAGFLAKRSFANQNVTIAVNDLTGGNLTVTAGGQTGIITAGAGVRSVTLTMGSTVTGNLTVNLAGTGCNFLWPRVAMGSLPALIIDRDETAMCMRYYQRYVRPPLSGLVLAGIGPVVAMVLPVPMRATPIISFPVQVDILDGASGSGNISAVGTSFSDPNQARFVPVLSSGSFPTAGLPIMVNSGGAGVMVLNAELTS